VRHGSKLDFNKNHFALKNPETITEVHIMSAGKEVRLIKKNDVWYAGNVRANAQLVSNLMMIATNLEALASVSAEKLNALLGNDPIKTRIIFLSRQRNILMYDLYELNNVVYAGKPGSDEYYRITVRGLSGIDIIGLFNVSQSVWQSNVIIDIPETDIRSVEVTYPTKPSEAFSISSLSNGEMQMKPDKALQGSYVVDREILNAYLFNFRNLKKLPVQPAPDSGIRLTDKDMIFILKIVTFSGDTVSLNGYRKTDDIIHKIDPDIFYGKLHNEGYMMLKYSDFDPILVSWDYFLKK